MTAPDFHERVAIRKAAREKGTPLCDYPRCLNPTAGFSVNQRNACNDHIEWAFDKAFEPAQAIRIIIEKAGA